MKPLGGFAKPLTDRLCEAPYIGTFPTLIVGGGVKCQKYLLEIAWNVQMCKEKNVYNPIPIGVRSSIKNVSAKNYMKYADLHRKIMYLSPTLFLFPSICPKGVGG